MTLYHSHDEYPYDYEQIPRLKQLLAEVDWDVVCVFDAIRWDAFEVVCDESDPVATPGKDTPTWSQEVWCDPDMDWSDVTYVSTNPATRGIREFDRYGGVIEEHVKEHVELFDSDRCTRDNGYGSEIMGKTAKEYEPPIVLHFMPPHTPFFGDIGFESMNIPEPGAAYADIIGEELGTLNTYDLVREGHISPEFARLSYLKNVEYVWHVSRPIRKRYDRVITTGDHGELLGPDRWGHTVTKDNRTRVVPFHTTWPCRAPSAEDMGASPEHQWITLDAPTQGTDDHPRQDTDDSTSDMFDDDLDQSVKERLRSLGYQKFPD